ncbi:TPA: AAA family ATPase [Klebsiella variicola]
MKIGLCGAQGSGKTTMAKALSERAGIPYIDAGVGTFLSDVGIDLANDTMPIVERMKIQLLVAGHIASLTEGPGLNSTGFVIDRTPIDVMAYTHDLAAPHYQNPEVMAVYDQIRLVCEESIRENFNLTILLRPGVELTDKDRKRDQRASLDPFYVRHIDMLMSSIIFEFTSEADLGHLSKFAMMNRDVLDLNMRVDSAIEAYNTLTDEVRPIYEPCH